MARKKVKRYAAGDEIIVTGRKAGQVGPDAASDFMLERMMRNSGGGGMGDMGGGGGGGGRRPITLSDPKVSVGKIPTPVGKVYGLRGIPVGKGSLSVGASPMNGGKVGGTFSTSFKKGGKLPPVYSR